MINRLFRISILGFFLGLIVICSPVNAMGNRPPKPEAPKPQTSKYKLEILKMEFILPPSRETTTTTTINQGKHGR